MTGLVIIIVLLLIVIATNTFAAARNTTRTVEFLEIICGGLQKINSHTLHTTEACRRILQAVDLFSEKDVEENPTETQVNDKKPESDFPHLSR